MREETRSALGIVLAFVGLGAIPVATHLAYQQGGFVKDTIDTAFAPPWSPTKYLIMATFALVFLALPFGIREWVAERRFVRLEREMRAQRPGDAIVEYVGPEGRGYLFDGPHGRTLLLEPPGGLGGPHVADLPPLPVDALPPAGEGMTTP